MSDYGRHDHDSRGRSRSRHSEDEGSSYGRGDHRDDRGTDDRSRKSSSMFGSGWGGRDDDRDRARGNTTDRGSRGDQSGSGDRSGRGTARDYGSDDQRDGLAIDETNRLIASNKVEGTVVYGRDNDRLGSIYNFMVDKYEGNVDYAVMTYGGFLGMGARYYPLPWQILRYDMRQGGYRVDMSMRDLERAPSFGRDDEPTFNRDYGERVYGYYGLNY